MLNCRLLDQISGDLLVISEKNRQLILGAAIGFVAIYVGWGYLKEPEYDDFAEAPAQPKVIDPAPKLVSVRDFGEVAKESEPTISEKDALIRDLEHQARVAQLKAIISEAESKANKARSESEKAEIEITRINADIVNQEKLTDIQLIRAQAETKQNHSPAPVYQPPKLPTIERKTTTKKPKVASVIPRPEETVILNSINGNGALLTIEGVMQLVPVGGIFNKVKLESVDHARSTVTVKGISTGRSRVLGLNSSDTRTYSDIKPLIDKNANPSDAMSLPLTMPIESLPDYTSVE